MKINIVENKILELVLQETEDPVLDTGSKSSKAKSKFSLEVDFEEKNFYITFHIKIATIDNVSITLTHKSTFETGDVISEGFKETHFPYVNAPAIAYPYVRTFVSNLTLNSGYSPVMLPSVNFAALYEKRKKAESQSEAD